MNPDEPEAPGVPGAERDLTPAGIRVVGEWIEIPLVEEVLVKKRVVREIVRIRKKTVVDEQTVEADLRREDVEVEPVGEAGPHSSVSEPKD